MIVLNVNSIYSWKEPGIIVNSSHSHWGGGNNAKIKLPGDFVSRCLWNPQLTYLGVHEVSFWRPSAVGASSSPLSYQLNSHGVINVITDNMEVSTTCGMNFENYPFDTQVIIQLSFTKCKIKWVLLSSNSCSIILITNTFRFVIYKHSHHLPH